MQINKRLFCQGLPTSTLLLFNSPALARQDQTASASGPGPRVGHMMTSAGLGGGVFLLTGAPEGRAGDDAVWLWTGSSWELASSTTGPAGPSLPAAAFDTRRRVLIVFGGNYARAKQDDTWEWDGSRWVQYEGPAPSPRDHHVMAYDEARGQAVMYGGHALLSGGDRPDGLVADTWTWDGAIWRRMPDQTDGPPPLGHHAMAYDSRRGRMVMFGGAPEEGPRSDQTWEWDGERWELRVIEGGSPPGRSHHRMAYDAARGVTVLFGGGIRGQTFSDTWTWDGVKWEQQQVEGPSARWMPAMAYDMKRERVVLVGGQGAGPGPYADVWEWDGARWEQMRP